MEKMCKNCGTPITKEYCEGYPEVCEHWTPKKPKTNADRIRAMTEEEMAEKFVNTAYYYDWKQDEDYYYFPNGTTKTNYKPKAVDAWLEWLKQPSEE